MTNRNLTALILRISGIFLFTKIFDHFGFYLLSIYMTTAIGEFREVLTEPINNFYGTGVGIIILNIVVSLILVIKADWISQKIIKKDIKIQTELNAESLTKVILLTAGVLWFANLVYLFPDFIEYSYKSILNLTSGKNLEFPDFKFSGYILKFILTLIIIFRIEKISNWITKKI